MIQVYRTNEEHFCWLTEIKMNIIPPTENYTNQ